MKPDSPAALVNLATEVIARIQRVSVRAGPEARLQLLGELALVGMRLDKIEEQVREVAKLTLKAVPRQAEGRQAMTETAEIPVPYVRYSVSDARIVTVSEALSQLPPRACLPVGPITPNPQYYPRS